MSRLYLKSLANLSFKSPSFELQNTGFKSLASLYNYDIGNPSKMSPTSDGNEVEAMYNILEEAYKYRMKIKNKEAKDLYISILDKYSIKARTELSLDEKYVLGWAFYDKGFMEGDPNLTGVIDNPDSAVEHLKEAIKTLEKRSLEDVSIKPIDELIAECNNRLGFQSMWLDQNYDEAISYYEKARSIYDRHENLIGQAEMHLEKHVALSLLNKLDEANSEIDTFLNIVMKALSGEEHSMHSKVVENDIKSEGLESTKLLATGKDKFQQAPALNSLELAKCFDLLGLWFGLKENYNKSVEYLKKAYEIKATILYREDFQNFEGFKKAVVNLNCVGKALNLKQYFEAVLQLSEEPHTIPCLFEFYIGAAMIHLNLDQAEYHKPEEALKFAYEGLALLEKNPEIAESGYAYELHKMLSDAHIKANHFPEAKRHANVVLDYEKKQLSKLEGEERQARRWRMIETYMILAKAEIGLGNINAAEGYFLQGKEIAKEYELDDNKGYLAMCCLEVGAFYSKIGKYELAIEEFYEAKRLYKEIGGMDVVNWTFDFSIANSLAGLSRFEESKAMMIEILKSLSNEGIDSNSGDFQMVRQRLDELETKGLRRGRG